MYTKRLNKDNEGPQTIKHQPKVKMLEWKNYNSVVWKQKTSSQRQGVTIKARV